MLAARWGAPPVPGSAELVEVGRRLPVREYLKRLWNARDFVLQVPLGQLRAQTSNTLLGGLWHLLNPLLYASLYYVIFGIIFQAARGVDNYAAFLVVGLFVFLFTSRTVQAGAQSVTSNVNLITQIKFPRAALPLAATVAETISHGVALLALLGMLLVLGETATWSWLLLPAITAVHALFNLGLAMVVSRLTFYFRDLQTLLPHVLRFWLYASGIFFTADLLIQRVGSDSILLEIFRANPAYVYVTLTRGILLGDPDPGLRLWLYGLAWSVAALVAGFLFFRARETEYGSG